MKEFLKQMASGDNGPSSKRGVMIWVLILWTGIIIVNLVTGKQPAGIFIDQVFEMLIIAFAGVFGEKAIDWLMTIKGRPLPPSDQQKTQP